MPRRPKKDITYITEQEVDAFFCVIRDPREKGCSPSCTTMDCGQASPAS
jgi:hypothetical protein